ncbi:MAG: hypothetical protein Q8O49_01115, partial [bacterium]|nr:hypothetical protein [bacterium]
MIAFISGILWAFLCVVDFAGKPIPIKDLPRYGVFISLNHFSSQESAGGQNGYVHLVRDNRGRVLLVLSKDQHLNNGKPFRVRNGKPVDF